MHLTIRFDEYGVHEQRYCQLLAAYSFYSREQSQPIHALRFGEFPLLVQDFRPRPIREVGFAPNSRHAQRPTASLRRATSGSGRLVVMRFLAATVKVASNQTKALTQSSDAVGIHIQFIFLTKQRRLGSVGPNCLQFAKVIFETRG
jgi:hypothetical protein